MATKNFEVSQSINIDTFEVKLNGAVSRTILSL